MASTEPPTQSGPQTLPADVIDKIIERADAVLATDAACEGSRIVTSAPGVIDVMGGITDYMGGLVLGMGVSPRVHVTLRRRTDDAFVVHCLQQEHSATDAGAPHIQFGLHRELNDTPSTQAFVATLDDVTRMWATPIVGVLHAMQATSKINNDVSGASIVIDGDMPILNDPAYRAPLAVATMAALAHLWGLHGDAAEFAMLAARAESDMFNMPGGLALPAVANLCHPGMIMGIDAKRVDAVRHVPLPDGVAIIGIDAGVRNPKLVDKYREARTAAYMGRRFIEQSLRDRGHSEHLPLQPLATINTELFREEFSGRIPGKLRGSVFLERFAGIEDDQTEVDANATYKIRSRAEHHVYDGDRTRRFAEAMQKAANANDREALFDAGDLMCNSHWSYTQRCGLVCVQAERLVKSLQDLRGSTGIHGARFSGYGCGGIVVVMIDDNAETHDAIRTVAKDYEQQLELKTTMLGGGGAGQFSFGIHEV